MNRRDAILKTSALVGLSLSAPLLSALLEGCKSDTERLDRPKGRVITQLHKKILSEMAEAIIPTTNTPGAKEAKVPEFIAMMIEDCYADPDRERFVQGITDLGIIAKNKYGKPFLECSPEEHTLLLTNMEIEARKALMRDNKTPFPFILMVKELTMVGYFTSKIGAVQALNYIAIPGRYDGCVPMQKGQRGWAT